MTLGMVRRRGSLRNSRLLATMIGVLAFVVAGACEPTAPPGFSPTPLPSAGPSASASASQGSAPVAGSPSITQDGATIQIVGLGDGISPDFDLPAGSAAMTVSVCASNQVIPFVTLYDADDNKLSIIVEPVYTLKNLTGGTYYFSVATNPTCVWTIEVTPG